MSTAKWQVQLIEVKSSLPATAHIKADSNIHSYTASNINWTDTKIYDLIKDFGFQPGDTVDKMVVFGLDVSAGPDRYNAHVFQVVQNGQKAMFTISGTAGDAHFDYHGTQLGKEAE